MFHRINWLKQRWRLLLVLLTPLVLLPIPIIGKSSQARCGYIVLILTVYWVFEAIPLPVTSLLPLALFPMAGILPAETVAPHYFKDIITLFFGSMSLAYAVESVNLHRRIALFVLSLVGTSSKWSMAGIMGVTAFLSMWMNNTAATSIMIPVAMAVTNELESYSKVAITTVDAFLLSVAYSASVGGISSLVGSAPNIFLKGFIDKLFTLRIDAESRAAQANLKTMLIKQYKDLGRPQWSEVSVGIIFISMIILWVTKDFSVVPGWKIIFRHKYISDGTVAILCGVLPMILPNANPFQKNWTYEPIVQWNRLAKNMPWGAMLLLGAGLVVATAFQVSKLSASVAHALRFLSGIPRAAVIFLVIIITGFFTEVTSNISTASIFFPILDSVARTSNLHPAYLLLPCTLAVSMAFMLPIATPPNAIIFASGEIRVIDMVKTGVVMNMIAFLVILFAATTWMPKIYGLNDRNTEIFFSINATSFNKTI
ncbi:unnamed protein product [Adineta steineri]|uniref:Citrate transporter-like domain-containing protein n=1 Tax=Adineta steineri TaxID=433720 RepID=A0A815M9A9_9BILA|nr:unnamed protein product [Adineta steineri]CAF1421432.1 unnamed protein product [Adineta steineri]